MFDTTKNECYTNNVINGWSTTQGQHKKKLVGRILLHYKMPSWAFCF